MESKFLGYENHALLSYSEDLKYFPSYLEQLEMESNGKQFRVDGKKTTHHTSPVILGGVGTDAQHSFFHCFIREQQLFPLIS